MDATTIGVIGCGYWGPNLLRNFAENQAAELRWICDLDQTRLTAMARRYPSVQGCLLIRLSKLSRSSLR